MIHRIISIGRWAVDFYFAVDGYDSGELLSRMYDYGASPAVMKRALDLTLREPENTGFTFTNPDERLAIVAIGPTTSGPEFVNTLVHEVHHLAVAIASELGIDLESESPAYIAGDSVRELADIICGLGCPCCHESP